MKTLMSIALLAFASITFAQTPVPETTPSEAEKASPAEATKLHPSPEQTVQQGLGDMTRFLASNPTPEMMKAFLNQYVSRYFDFGHMARKAAGGWYNRLYPQERIALIAEMRAIFLGAMANRLMSYETKEIEVQRARYFANRRAAIVPIVVQGKRPLRIVFKMAQDQHGWRIYDITANGQSAVVHYRRLLMAKFAQAFYR